MNIEIQKIVYPGKSFANQNGKVIFTDEGLPGEIVEIKPIREKKNYIEAETLNVLNPSKKRANPLCPHYKICSPYQYIDYSYQLELKEFQVKEIFARNLDEDLNDFKIAPSPKIWGYRNKLRLHLLWENNTASLAYHALEAHNKFVPIGGCHLASENMNNLFSALIEALNNNKFKFIEEIEIKETTLGRLLLVIYAKTTVDYKNMNSFIKDIAEISPIDGIIYVAKEKSAETFLYGKNYIEEKIDNKIFRIGAQSFFQINAGILKLLIADIKEAVKLRDFKIVADLYCGIGTFGIIFADKAQKLLGVELLEENISFLKENIQVNHINNYNLHKGLSEDLISEILKEKIDTLIVDPPRKGIGQNICEKLLKAGPKHIFYISCDPVTLARDLKMLLQKYDLAKVYGYDFFPHTPHIETFTVLDRK